MRRGFTLVVAAMLAFAGCQQETKVSDSDIPILDIEELDAAMADSFVVLVDVRKPDAYAAGHLPNAINIYLPDIRGRDPRLANAKRIVVYAKHVRDPLGVAAAKRMIAMGYINVQEFKGGVAEWERAGRSLVGALPEAEIRPDTDR